ncbi:hypothetical protein [Streptomyces sp. NPDC047042]|uniref:hypothetical protein n=1 Tax=Streptomyces sp. NPDC047042 TaxID=3154807 RepID=UPI0033FB6063
MTDRATIAAGLRRLGEEGRPASEAAHWVLRHTRETGEDLSAFQLMIHFFATYQVPVEHLRELELWEGLGTGGSMTDAELDAVVGPLRVRETPPS